LPFVHGLLSLLVRVQGTLLLALFIVTRFNKDR
jgi:hypothetical protein